MMSSHDNSAFEPALSALELGDASRLGALLQATPELVHARWTGDAVPYDGYFNGATLLHHVAGNPWPTALPAGIVRCAEVLLDAGADIDARTRAGPSQPDDPGWTTLGLVATSAAARSAGVQLELMDLLLARGADIDDQRLVPRSETRKGRWRRTAGVQQGAERELAGASDRAATQRDAGAPSQNPSVTLDRALDGARGLPIVGAVYYGELEAARELAHRGAAVDLLVACGLGDLERARVFISSQGLPTDDACGLVDYTLVPRPEQLEPAEILSLALVYAALGGSVEVTAWLVSLGADLNVAPEFDHRARPLHWAAMRGHTELVAWLLTHGADPTIRDERHDATALGWAEHGGNADTAALVARALEQRIGGA